MGRRQVRELGWEEEGRGEGRGERGMNGRRGDKEGKVDIGRSVCNAGKTIKGKCSGEGRGEGVRGGSRKRGGGRKDPGQAGMKGKGRGGGEAGHFAAPPLPHPPKYQTLHQPPHPTSPPSTKTPRGE